MRRGAALGVILWLTTMSLAVQATAHQPSDYPYPWTYSITNRVFYFKGSYPTGNWRDRVDDAMTKWNNVSGAALSFSTGGNAQSGDAACGARDIVSHRDISAQMIATTIWCSTQDSTVEIAINTDYEFDGGSDTPNNPNRWDLQAVLTHELGHATRGWLLCASPDSPSDPEPPACHGRHYDSTYNGAICDFTDVTTYSTMCLDNLAMYQSWRRRSLETHDEDIFAAAY